MTLLVTVVAAIVSTLVWYQKENRRELKLSLLVFMYWGASIMWFVDEVAAYLEDGAQHFTPAPYDMLNDLFLGVCVITFGFLIWLVRYLISDPRKVFHKG